MNYEIIAVELGDRLKYDTSVKQINRRGRAIFPFAKQNFPNDQITSSRAKQIYDWILTLASEKMDSERRESLLIEFCDKITPESLQDEVFSLLKENGISLSLLNKQNYEAFSARNFHRKVAEHSRDLFLQSNYFHAVFESARLTIKQ